MRLAVLGLSLSSAWGNGHATTWRALLKGLALRGWDIVFLEREQPWYAAHRDLEHPDFCRLVFYEQLTAQRAVIAGADAVLVGSYVPQGAQAIDQVLAWARAPVLFYDLDTPLTLAALQQGGCAYLRAEHIPRFAAYLSFTGGPTLERLQRSFGARRAQALYCCVDPLQCRPAPTPKRWELSYLGTYSPDRQPALERLLLAPARARPDLAFCVAGPQYPEATRWPANVARIPHLAPGELPGFFGASRFTLNLTRAAMAAAGYSPSVRLFEAAACATAILTDRWAGLEACFCPGKELLQVEDGAQVQAALELSEAERTGLGRRARARAVAEHSGAVRAQQLEAMLLGPCAQA